jgi:preprotein translocase subunit SecF
MIQFIKHKNIFLVLTLIGVVACIAAIAVYRLKPSIEFTGGSILELQYKGALPNAAAVNDAIKDLNLKDISVYTVGSDSISLRTETLSQDTHVKLLADLKKTGDFQEKSFETIGPVVGNEIKNRTVALIIVSLLAMLIYIAIAFKNVPGPISSWKYGVASFAILTHDVLVPLGVLAVLGKEYGVQITVPIITALLTVVGYAINNVIVVYDRIRENLTRDRKASFEEIANRAINQTLSRQINTSLATLLPVFAIYFWGGDTLKYFALALILGIVTGTYSSIFLSSQILVVWMKLGKKK